MQVTYYIVQTMNGYWGRGKGSVADAKREAKRQGGSLKKFLLHCIKQDANLPVPYIDGCGGLVHWGDPFVDVRTWTCPTVMVKPRD